jgi:ubiquinone/menaquinone biosynthesis C-methylase UbiE
MLCSISKNPVLQLWYIFCISYLTVNNRKLSLQFLSHHYHLLSPAFFFFQVDFGCGSGSLLDSLLDYPTSLEKIVGADLSKKSLSRAAKV